MIVDEDECSIYKAAVNLMLETKSIDSIELLYIGDMGDMKKYCSVDDGWSIMWSKYDKIRETKQNQKWTGLWTFLVPKVPFSGSNGKRSNTFGYAFSSHTCLMSNKAHRFG